MKILLLFVLSTLSISLLAQKTTSVDKLTSSFNQLKKENNETNQIAFFQFFPNSFETFEQTFGFKNGEAAPLYDGHPYIVQFFSLDKIPKNKQMKNGLILLSTDIGMQMQ